MKWLVQTLDSLLSNCPEDQAYNEQQNLEALITRYKNLIPNLEITMTKTETLTKCYTYKREVREVCELLKKVKEQSKQERQPETLENVNQMIHQQEMAVSQLDLQRPNIMTMLQRGKELAKESSAPPFVKEEVKALEFGWNETYEETVDKLNKLKTTQTIWSNFDEQKTEILELLTRAHQELQRIAPGQYTSSNIPGDLQSKQELCIYLREVTEDMLRKLRDLASKLTEYTAPTKKPLVEREVEEIHTHLQNTIETVQERVVFLQKLNDQWLQFHNRLGELQTWSVQDVPHKLNAIEDDIAPEDRLMKATALKSEVSQKLNLADELGIVARDLILDESNPEAQKVKAEVIAMQDKMSAIHRNVEAQSSTVVQDLQNWNHYQGAIQEIKPWVDQAEIKIQMGFPKPSTLAEAMQLQNQTQQFGKECEMQLKNIHGVAGISQQILSKTHAPDEVDAMHSRWTVIHDIATQWGNKYDKLVTNWNDFDNNANKLENWIVNEEKSLNAEAINTETPEVDKLEKELAKLKAFNNEISEQQAKLIALTQNSDLIGHALTPEGASAVKGRVQELKGNMTKLSEAVRAKINDVSDAILARHEFIGKMAEFSNWSNRLRGNVEHIDEVPADKVDVALINVHALLQEHYEKQPAFNAIYGEVKSLTLKSTPEDNQTLNREYSNLVENYQNLDDQLQQKKIALEKWTDLLNWHEETGRQLSHVKYQIDSQKIKPENLQILVNETESIINKLIIWKQNAPAIDSLKGITILDKNTGLPTTAENLVREIEVKTINLKSQLVDKLGAMEKLQAHWNSFQGLQKHVTDNLADAKNQLQEINNRVVNSADLQNAVADINKLLEAQAQKIPIKEELQRQGQQLMKEDLQNASAIQGTISALDSKWDQIQDEIKSEKLKYGDIIFAWKEFQDIRDRVDKEIEKIDHVCGTLETPTDAIQANSNNEKAKRTLDNLKRIKTLLDKVDQKADVISKKGGFIPKIESEVKSNLKETHQHWTRVYEKILKIVHTAESQAIIWKHIEETKSKLLQWLGEQNSILSAAAEKPNEVESAKAKLAKYREELPSYLSLRQSIPNKHKQIAKLSNDKEIPMIATLEKLLDDQFSEIQQKAEKLDKVTSVFGEKEKAIRKDIKDVGNTISNIREEMIKCEDLSGDNAKILERLLKCQSLKQELQNCDSGIKHIEQQIVGMKTIYPSFSESNIPKEQQLLKKRYDGVLSHANKIENTLLSFLKKFHNEKYGALQRMISTHKEKIQWCCPEPGSDKYNLEVKLNALSSVESAIQDCENRKLELETSLKLLEAVETPENYKLMIAEKEHLDLELDNLKHAYSSTSELLQRNVKQHEQYEQLSENISTFLKDIENKVRNESVNQLDMNNVNVKINEVTSMQTDVFKIEPEINNVILFSEEIIKEVPESRCGQFAQHLQARHQAIVKFLSNYLEKLNELNKYKDLYGNSINDVETWLTQAENKVKTFEEYTARGSKPNQATLEELKQFASEREKGQTLLNKAVEHGEALFSGITPENREAIRTELRTLRDKSEALIDRVNAVYKQVETILMQRHSFEDSLKQVKLWIADAEQKLGSKLELDSTLPEKKDTLHKYRSVAQDVNLHKNILQQLQDKIKNLGDSEVDLGLQDSLEKYQKLSTDVNERVTKVENFVTNHESYNQAIEKCRDWLSALTAEAALLIDDSALESPETKLTIVDNLLGQKDEGDKIIDSCKKQLEIILNETSPEGHPALINSFEEQAKAWNTFLSLCLDAKVNLGKLYSQYAEFGKLVDDLETWLKQKEAQVKDQSLRSTEETKRGHLDKLKSLEEDISSKTEDFNKLSEKAQGLDSDSDIPNRVSQLITRYEFIQNAVKEGIKRYETFVKEHKAFNASYAEFVMWLSEKQEDLQALSHIVGDVAILQQRHERIKDLIDQRNRQSEKFENLVEDGERLYAHTSPDGREIIRQQLRNLRTIWDGFTDDLQNATNKLDQCLIQFSDFTATQEQLTKWLKDVEKAMHQHTELKATLQEKRAQLQNHKIMHQEITSHQQLVDSVCDKAQQLVDQTKDKSLNIYLQSIKQLFKNIVTKSEDLLNNLGECVDSHNQFNVLVNNFRLWLDGQSEKLQEFNEIGGEKTDILKRIEAIKALKKNEIEGKSLLEKIKEQLIIVAQSTAPKGVDELKKELEELHELLGEHMNTIGKLNML